MLTGEKLKGWNKSSQQRMRTNPRRKSKSINPNTSCSHSNTRKYVFSE